MHILFPPHQSNSNDRPFQILSCIHRVISSHQSTPAHLSVKLLLIRLHVDTTLNLGRRRAELKASLTERNRAVESSKGLRAHILERVLKTSSQVWNELGDGATVGNGTRDTLSNKDRVALREVAGGTGVGLLGVLGTSAGLLVLHGVDGAHTTVSLDELALAGDEGGSWGFGGTGEETTHHDGGGTEGETLDDVANVLDTTVGHTWNAEAGSESGNLVDGSGLWATDSHNLLGDAGRAGAHTDTETVNAGGDEGGGLVTGNDVSADNLEIWEGGLDPLDHLDLVHGVTLGGVEDDDIKTGIDKLLQTDLVLWAGADSGGADELLGIWELGGVWEVEVLGQIGAGDHGDEVAGGIDDWELALLGLGEDSVGLGEGGALWCSDELSDHDGGDWLLEVLLELDVTVGDDTDELGAELSILSDWETTESPLLLQELDILNGLVLGEDNWVEDEAVLVTLDLLDHLGLLIWRAVVVDNTKATLKSHGDSHLMLGDGVHRRRDEWSLEGDSLGDWRLEVDGRGWEANVTWKDEEIVVCEPTVLVGVEELLNGQAITLLVLVLEDVHGGAGVEDLLALGEAQTSWYVAVGERHFV